MALFFQHCHPKRLKEVEGSAFLARLNKIFCVWKPRRLLDAPGVVNKACPRVVGDFQFKTDHYPPEIANQSAVQFFARPAAMALCR
jgi:hypothetical protein